MLNEENTSRLNRQKAILGPAGSFCFYSQHVYSVFTSLRRAWFIHAADGAKIIRPTPTSRRNFQFWPLHQPGMLPISDFLKGIRFQQTAICSSFQSRSGTGAKNKVPLSQPKHLLAARLNRGENDVESDSPMKTTDLKHVTAHRLVSNQLLLRASAIIYFSCKAFISFSLHLTPSLGL